MSRPTWTELVEAEPRLAALLNASRETLRTHIHILDHYAVYDMAKAYIVWLVGFGRGLMPKSPKPPHGSALAEFERTVRIFDTDRSWLTGSYAYESAITYVASDLYSLDLSLRDAA